MKLTPEQLEQARNAKNAAELAALAGENGIELTRETAEACFSQLQREGTLTDEELANVSGGWICDPEPPIYTAMLCDNCGANTFWTGDYVNGKMYKCPLCEHETYHGTHTTDHTGW